MRLFGEPSVSLGRQKALISLTRAGIASWGLGP